MTKSKDIIRRNQTKSKDKTAEGPKNPQEKSCGKRNKAGIKMRKTKFDKGKTAKDETHPRKIAENEIRQRGNPAGRQGNPAGQRRPGSSTRRKP